MVAKQACDPRKQGLLGVVWVHGVLATAAQRASCSNTHQPCPNVCSLCPWAHAVPELVPGTSSRWPISHFECSCRARVQHPETACGRPWEKRPCRRGGDADDARHKPPGCKGRVRGGVGGWCTGGPPFPPPPHQFPRLSKAGRQDLPPRHATAHVIPPASKCPRPRVCLQCAARQSRAHAARVCVCVEPGWL